MSEDEGGWNYQMVEIDYSNVTLGAIIDFTQAMYESIQEENALAVAFDIFKIVKTSNELMKMAGITDEVLNNGVIYPMVFFHFLQGLLKTIDGFEDPLWHLLQVVQAHPKVNSQFIKARMVNAD